MLISSLTSGMYLVRPKSDRFSVADTSPPQTVFLCSPMVLQRKPFTVTLSGLVTPSRVNCPSAATTLSPLKTRFCDVNVIVGNFSTLNSPSLIRCADQRSEEHTSELQS